MEQVQKHLHVLILAGGGGTRLWPLSRDHTPKQFLKLFKGKSLYSITLNNAKALVDPKRIFITTNSSYYAQVKKLSPGIPAENIILEPIRRDTAMAMGFGAVIIQHYDPEAIIINLASDHLIQPISVFKRDMYLAAEKAYKTDELITVGIKPRFPHTGMGHIKTQAGVGIQFVEKPDLETAKKFTAAGNYYWNANLYVWKASVLLKLLHQFAPKTYAQLPNIGKKLGTSEERSAIKFAFQMAPSISIDYAISEKLKKFGFVPARFHWTDIGDWSEVWNNLEKDKFGNSVYGEKGQGELISINSKNNLFILDKQLITTVGIENMIIIDTKDALLVCRVEDDQAVKQLVKILKEKKLTKYL